MIRHPRSPTLFPYPPLSRSGDRSDPAGRVPPPPRPPPAGCRPWRSPEAGICLSAWPPGCPCPSRAVRAGRGQEPWLFAGKADGLGVGGGGGLLADIAIVRHLGQNVELSSSGGAWFAAEVVVRR